MLLLRRLRESEERKLFYQNGPEKTTKSRANVCKNVQADSYMPELISKGLDDKIKVTKTTKALSVLTVETGLLTGTT